MTCEESNRSILLTPGGAGAIGVIRVAGPDADFIVHRLFRAGTCDIRRADSTQDSPPTDLADGRIRYGRIVDGGEVIDDVLISLARANDPSAIDVCAHGGVRVIERILDALERHGAPIDHQSEAVDTAWPCGDAIEREAIRALVAAKTERGVRFLAWQRRHLAERVRQVAAECVGNPEMASASLQRMLAGYRAARALIDGATVVLVGPPNSGKSTLFNRLVGRLAAIVSPHAGTTRDWVSATISFDGIPVTLVDTAGQHDATEMLERQAIEQGKAAAERATLRILVLDGAREPTALTRGMLVASGVRTVVAINKSDLAQIWDRQTLPLKPSFGLVGVSAQEGDGVEALVTLCLQALGIEALADSTPCFFTPRQFELAGRALSDLPDAPAAARKVLVAELIESEGP